MQSSYDASTHTQWHAARLCDKCIIRDAHEWPLAQCRRVCNNSAGATAAAAFTAARASCCDESAKDAVLDETR
jgi:hypothetical protein